MNSPQRNRLKLLLDEVDQQLRKLACGSLETGKVDPGIIKAHASNVSHRYSDNLRNLASCIESILAELSNPGSGNDVHTEITDKSLVWQIPAFSGERGVIDQDFVKGRIEALQRHRSAEDQHTDDIWNERDILRWEENERSSVIIVEGTSQTLPRLQNFGVLMVNHLSKTQHDLHLLSPLPTTVSLAENDVLRQLAIQCLQKLSGSELPLALEFIASTISHFHSGLDEDYFSVMEESLCRLSAPVSIVLNTECIRPAPTCASPWPFVFQELCIKIGERVSSRLNVMLISGRKLNSGRGVRQVPIVRVLTCPALGDSQTHPMEHHFAIRPNRTPSSVFSRNIHSIPSMSTCHVDQADAFTATKGETPAPYAQVASTTETAHTTNTLLVNTHKLVQNSRKDKILVDQCEVDDPAQHEDNLDLEGFQVANSSLLTGSTGSWFKFLGSRTHETLYRRMKHGPKPYQLVKVAVLDTGFAYTEANDKRALKPYRQRIAKFSNFVDDGMDDSAAMQDPSGHGTAVALQVLNVSLTAVLYVCRVSRQEGDGTWHPDKYAVESAIRMASTPENDGGWGVDIVNMSFGWEFNDHPGLRGAIQLARMNGVHMFAPTSNDGLLGPPNDISYPAIALEVISIDAADGLGEHTRTSPSSQSIYGGSKRFTAPGVDLLGSDLENKVSGSSFACAVAAGVGALILEFVRQPPLDNSPTMQKIVKEMLAMTAILRLMSKSKGPDEPRFLLPWLLLGNVEESTEHTSYIIVRELRKLYGRELGKEVHPHAQNHQGEYK